MDAVKIMADERAVISYRPRFNKHTGSVLATILLQQATYWWCKMGEKPYYKFKEPCASGKYKAGESWCEELGFSRREFDTAKSMLEDRGFISVRTDMERLTWYSVSSEKINEMMDLVYESRKGGNSLYVKAENADSKGGKRLLSIQEITHKITTEDLAVCTAPTPKPKTQKTAMPAEFGLSEAVKAWAATNGHTQLEKRLDHFRGYATANGKKYANWDQAFMNAVRDDWAKLNGGQGWQQQSQHAPSIPASRAVEVAPMLPPAKLAEPIKSNPDAKAQVAAYLEKLKAQGVAK